MFALAEVSWTHFAKNAIYYESTGDHRAWKRITTLKTDWLVFISELQDHDHCGISCALLH